MYVPNLQYPIRASNCCEMMHFHEKKINIIKRILLRTYLPMYVA